MDACQKELEGVRWRRIQKEVLMKKILLVVSLFSLLAISCESERSRGGRLTIIPPPMQDKNPLLVAQSVIPGVTNQARVYRIVLPFTIAVENESVIATQGFKLFGVNARGYYDKNTRTLHVPVSEEKDRFGNNLPAFETLGHELWHLPELGALFHTNKSK